MVKKMYKKRLVIFVLILLVLSSFVVASDDESCDSVLEKVWCFLWGNPDNRAGAAWWDRGLPWYDPEGGALVGGVINPGNLEKCDHVYQAESQYCLEGNTILYYSAGDGSVYSTKVGRNLEVTRSENNYAYSKRSDVIGVTIEEYDNLGRWKELPGIDDELDYLTVKQQFGSVAAAKSWLENNNFQSMEAKHIVYLYEKTDGDIAKAGKWGELYQSNKGKIDSDELEDVYEKTGGDISKASQFLNIKEIEDYYDFEEVNRISGGDSGKAEQFFDIEGIEDIEDFEKLHNAGGVNGDPAKAKLVIEHWEDVDTALEVLDAAGGDPYVANAVAGLDEVDNSDDAIEVINAAKKEGEDGNSRKLLKKAKVDVGESGELTYTGEKEAEASSTDVISEKDLYTGSAEVGDDIYRVACNPQYDKCYFHLGREQMSEEEFFENLNEEDQKRIKKEMKAAGWVPEGERTSTRTGIPSQASYSVSDNGDVVVKSGNNEYTYELLANEQGPDGKQVYKYSEDEYYVVVDGEFVQVKKFEDNEWKYVNAKGEPVELNNARRSSLVNKEKVVVSTDDGGKVSVSKTTTTTPTEAEPAPKVGGGWQEVFGVDENAVNEMGEVTAERGTRIAEIDQQIVELEKKRGEAVETSTANTVELVELQNEKIKLKLDEAEYQKDLEARVDQGSILRTLAEGGFTLDEGQDIEEALDRATFYRVCEEDVPYCETEAIVEMDESTATKITESEYAKKSIDEREEIRERYEDLAVEAGCTLPYDESCSDLIHKTIIIPRRATLKARSITLKQKETELRKKAEEQPSQAALSIDRAAITLLEKKRQQLIGTTEEGIASPPIGTCKAENNCIIQKEGDSKGDSTYMYFTDGNGQKVYQQSLECKDGTCTHQGNPIPLNLEIPPDTQFTGTGARYEDVVIVDVRKGDQQISLVGKGTEDATPTEVPTPLLNRITQDGEKITKVTETGIEVGEKETKRTLEKTTANTGWKTTQNQPDEEGNIITKTAWYDSKAEPLYSQTSDNPNIVIARDGKAYTTTEDWDPVNGMCNEEPCLVGTEGDLQGRMLMDGRANPFQTGMPALREEWKDKNGNVEEEWEWTDAQGNEYEGDRSCKGECDNKEGDSDSLEINGFTRYSTQYEIEDGDDRREYNTQTVGVFALVDEGVGWGNCEESCSNEVFFSADNDYACSSSPCTRMVEDENGNLVPNPNYISTDDESWANEFCKSDETCIKKAEEAHNTIGTGLFFAGKQEWQQAIGASLNLFSGWNSMSMALFGDAYALELASDIDRWFAGSVLSEEYWESSYCYAQHGDIQDEGYAFIETPGGFFQAVASIQAEMSESPIPLLCTPLEEEFVCPGNLYCGEDQFCYESEDAEEPVESYFYKITWGVTAPSDEALTPYSTEAGAVVFNIYLGNTKLYSRPIGLKNGESYNDKIAHYSNNQYQNQEVCIRWVNAPLTLKRGGSAGDFIAGLTVVGGLATGGGTNTVKDVCYTIKPTVQGQVGETSSYSSAGSIESGEVTRNLNW